MEQLHTQSVSDYFIQSLSESKGLFDSLSNKAAVKHVTSTRPVHQQLTIKATVTHLQ